ncbi:MAG: S-layer homology domain-containing protein [Lyngbya sp.]|nr:S-layer homology domain-containing protein [Lyngbya sp.]
MSHSIPPNSSSPQGSSRNDEWIAVLVALLAMGGIFLWIVGRDAKPYKQKFASPARVAVPEATVSNDLNLSRVLEESFARSRREDLPDERVAIPRTSNRNLFQIFSADDRTVTVSESRGINPVWGFTPFFFAAEDTESGENVGSPVTIAPIPTQEPTATPPETEASPQPQQQAAPPETETSPQPQQQAAPPETEASPQPQQQAAPPETETSPQPQQQAAQPETETTIVPIIPPQEPTATEPDTEASPQPQQQAAQPDTATPTPVPLVLSDVPEGFWAKEFIEYTTQEDIIIPYANGTFKPDQPITRAEFAAQIENAFVPEENKSGQPSYQDVEQNYWAEQAIVDVTKTGFMTGYPGEIFRPNEVVPRVQVLVALASGLNLKPPKNPQETLQKAFQDADQIPQWAVEKIAAATQAGLVVNHPKTNTLNPNQPATRAEVSAMIYQALVESNKAEPISSDYIVKPQK